MATYSPSAADALKLGFAGIDFDDPAAYVVHNNKRIDAKFFLKPIQDEVMALQEAVFKNVEREVWNDSGAQIDAGKMVFISGWNAANSKLTIEEASDSDPTKQAVYVLTENIADGASGTVYASVLATGLNTTGTIVGDKVYLSGTTGGWSKTAPTGADKAVQAVGRIVEVHASTGQIEFFPALGLLEKIGTSWLADASITPAKLNDAIADAMPKIDIAVGAEAADAIAVTLQMQDIQGNSLAENHLIELWLSDSATGVDTGTAPSAGISASTGQVQESIVANKRVKVETDATGKAVIDIGEAGAATWYLRCQSMGKIFTSAAITFA